MLPFLSKLTYLLWTWNLYRETTLRSNSGGATYKWCEEEEEEEATIIITIIIIAWWQHIWFSTDWNSHDFYMR